MTIHLISQRSPLDGDIGYPRKVVDRHTIYVPSTNGFDYATMDISEDVAEQTEQCLRNIALSLTQAGASIAEVVRVRYILPNADDFRACWRVLRAWFGDVRPAATMFATGLADPRMKIEIEVTASGKRPG